MLSKSNPGTIKEVLQLHVKGIAVRNKLYYGRDNNGIIHTYRGTHEGRLKEETALVTAENDIDVNTVDIDVNKSDITILKGKVEVIEATLPTKADKCFATAMSIVLSY